MTKEAFVMDHDELREHLREVAATGSIDASTDRAAVDSRARLYRRHRRQVASAFVVLGVAGMLVVLIVLTSSGNGSQSVRVPPAQSTVAPPPPTNSVADCVRRTEEGQRVIDPKGDPTKLSFFDHGTGGAATLTVEDYCQQVVVIENAGSCAAPAGWGVVNGRIACLPPSPTTTTAP
jgi:hypothetical protein